MWGFAGCLSHHVDDRNPEGGQILKDDAAHVPEVTGGAREVINQNRREQPAATISGLLKQVLELRPLGMSTAESLIREHSDHGHIVAACVFPAAPHLVFDGTGVLTVGAVSGVNRCCFCAHCCLGSASSVALYAARTEGGSHPERYRSAAMSAK